MGRNLAGYRAAGARGKDHLLPRLGFRANFVVGLNERIPFQPPLVNAGRRSTDHIQVFGLLAPPAHFRAFDPPNRHSRANYKRWNEGLDKPSSLSQIA